MNVTRRQVLAGATGLTAAFALPEITAAAPTPGLSPFLRACESVLRRLFSATGFRVGQRCFGMIQLFGRAYLRVPFIMVDATQSADDVKAGVDLTIETTLLTLGECERAWNAGERLDDPKWGDVFNREATLAAFIVTTSTGILTSDSVEGCLGGGRPLMLVEVINKGK